MILHTIVNPAEVLYDETQQPVCEYVNRDGCIIECMKQGDERQIRRIISTNPKDYLTPSYQIGNRL